MKVIHFGKYYPPHRGGMESFLAALCRGLIKRGVACEAIVAADGEHPSVAEDAGVQVRRLRSWGTFRSLPVCPEAMSALRGLRADIINLHHPNPMADISYLLAQPEARLVVTYHSDIISQPWLSRLYAPFLHKILDRADAIVATSHHYIDSSPVLQRYRRKIRIIPLGFDPPDFAMDEFLDNQRGNEPQYFFVGRLVPYKGVPVLLEALQYTAGRLLIGGTGPWEKNLKQQVALAKLQDRVKFLGNISEAEKFQHLAGCDVFVLPSINRAEAFGMVLLEAMAMGRPVVVSDLPTGVRLLVQDGVNGFRFPPGEAPALARILRYLADNPAQAKRLGESGRQLVREEYTVDRMVNRYFDLYDELLTSNLS